VPAASDDPVSEPLWWQTGVIYQIYPRSFADGNGDGIGDLTGIEAHLDYVVDLGMDAIWLSPIFPSPMADFGYDIADYTDVAPEFGTLADLDRLVAAAHERGMKLLLDLVPNHTSDEHPWFVESRGADSPRRDWYLWRDAAPDGGPPNNWKSFFGGPAWEWDAGSAQYYLHLFHRKQPDLNWRNPDVRAAIYEVMRFWLDRGVDGFRLDAYWLLFKDPDYPNEAPPRPLGEGELSVGRYEHPAYEDRAEMLEVVREMRSVTDEYDERVLVGELYLPLPRLMAYYGNRLDGLHLPFNFSLVTMTRWDAPSVRQIIERYEAALPTGAWPNWVVGNHDVPRVATRAGAGGAGPAGGRLAQMLLLTLRGTPTCYAGDELGMPNGDIPPDRVVDPQAAAGRTRDVSRTPMVWDDSPNAGFCPEGVQPWLPIAMPPDGSVAAQERAPTSSLTLTRRLVSLRRSSPALVTGTIGLLDLGERGVVAYLRQADDERMLVALNFSGRDLRLDASVTAPGGTVLCSTAMDRAGAVDLAVLALRPYEGVLVILD
jgi:alpha-glucosidase